jgi:hypothetical protein
VTTDPNGYLSSPDAMLAFIETQRAQIEQLHQRVALMTGLGDDASILLDAISDDHNIIPSERLKQIRAWQNAFYDAISHHWRRDMGLEAKP